MTENPDTNWQNQRKIVLERDNYSCINCGGKDNLHVHHLVLRFAGGGDETCNLITLCSACHATRHITLQAKLSRRFIERWAHKIAKWVDYDKVLPEEKINFGPVLRLFGVTRFRPGQLDVVLAALRGESVLYISPTGSGKSLCYQVPALLRPNVEVVFSPLKTLMSDQVRKLQELGIPSTFINSDISKDEKELRFKLLESNSLKYVYLAPERFGDKVHPDELTRLKKIRPSLLVLDEAHVLPKWRKSFRPDYDRMEDIRKDFDNPPILAFTATAGLETQKQIISQLGAEKMSVFIRDVDRPNIYLKKYPAKSYQERLEIILGTMEEAKKEKGKIMIFVPTVKQGEKVAELFASEGKEVPFYHSRLPMLERDKIQNRFLGMHKPELNAIICTNAFGMGLEIPNIRAVIHWQYPASIEDYVQEYGRAGRDGKEAQAILFYNKCDKVEDDDDFRLQKFMIEMTLDKSGLEQFERDAEYKFSVARLQDMRNYAISNAECLRKQISSYFDDDKTRKKFNLSKFILNFIFTTKPKEKKIFKCCSACGEKQT